MANEQNNNNNRIDIEIDAETAQGKYANLAIISHSHSEFVLDFASLLPGLPKAKVRSRIILTPEHAKRLLRSLEDNVARYERNVGKISERGGNPPMGGFNVGQA